MIGKRRVNVDVKLLISSGMYATQFPVVLLISNENLNRYESNAGQRTDACSTT